VRFRGHLETHRLTPAQTYALCLALAAWEQAGRR